jgi:putative SOS response-associated peptidase YedK
MCTNYTPTARDRFRASRLGVAHLPQQDWPPEVFPGYQAPIVVPGGAPGDTKLAPRVELARFGLIPRWCRDKAQATAIARGTYNARSETASAKPSFRSPWREQHWALAPMESYFDPCWDTGKAVRWRIHRADGEPFACAGLWERWCDPATAETITSFTLLTVNADGHPLCGRMHRPGDEKRMPVIVEETAYEAWLNATSAQALAFMKAFPASELSGEPAPLAPHKRVLKPSTRPGNIPLFDDVATAVDTLQADTKAP